VPHQALEFVILCGGGKVESERELSAAEVASKRFTHQVVDRPALLGAPLPSRDYVQPQWVFDSFNSSNAVPVAAYASGKCTCLLSSRRKKKTN
jgi:pescadillo protein